MRRVVGTARRMVADARNLAHHAGKLAQIGAMVTAAKMGNAGADHGFGQFLAQPFAELVALFDIADECCRFGGNDRVLFLDLVKRWVLLRLLLPAVIHNEK